MPLTQEAINELKQIHKNETVEELSDGDAWEMGTNLLRFFKAACRLGQSKAKDESAYPQFGQWR